MSCLKRVDRSAFVAMAPEAPFMAAGTMAGAVDLSFSSSANLDIFELDFHSNEHELKSVGQCPSSERFNQLAWGSYGSGSEELPYGLIAGGLVDGNIGLWNPLSLIRSEANESAHVRHLSKHKGPVRALEFNAISRNQLASGADDGTICIWDLENHSSEPSHFLKGNGSYMHGEISSVSWNREFKHVLASTSSTGTTVIWDVNNEKVITGFNNYESNERFKGLIRCSVLQWDPDNCNQIMVASDEDSSPTVKLLDIRYPQSPVRTFVGHHRGVIAMEWCPSDSLYLLTCARDNRTICWNTKTTQFVAELPTANNWNFDVHWYPKIPGVVSASSADGKIGIYNLEGCSRNGSGESNLDSAPLTAPQWWKRPVGASFGFGGKLVSFNSKFPEASVVFLHSLATEKSLVNRITKFEAAIENGGKTSLRGLCEKKSEEAESEEEKETWGLLKIMLEEDGTSKTKLLTHLGFSLHSEDQNDQAVNAPHATECFANVEDTQQMPEAEEEKSDLFFDDAIQRSLIVGNYKEAVAQCLSANNMADALNIPKYVNVAGEGGQACTMVVRTAHWVIPHYRVWGVPFFLFYSTRASQFIHDRPNQSFLRTLFCPLFSLLRAVVSKFIESYVMWKLPLEKYGLKPEHSFEEDYASCQMAIMPESFFEEADKGMIRFKKTSKWCFYDEGIEFEDGTTLEADVVILATGYDGKKKLKAILPEPFRTWLEFPCGVMPLYRGTIHPLIPNMGFVGYVQSNANLRTSELRSLWLSRLVDEKFKLPSKEKMLDQFSKEMEVMRRSSRFYKRHCISTFSIQHADDLCNDMGLNPRRNSNLFLEAFSPYGSQDYRLDQEQTN